MPNVNPAEPGDLVYPKYAAVTTEPIDAGLQIIKGRLYTVDSVTNFGNLIDVVDTLVKGFFQAMTTPESVGAADPVDTVQVAGPRTRMMFTAALADMVVGQDVIYVVGGTNVTTGDESSNLYVGKIFEIYSRNNDPAVGEVLERKYSTAINDKVIVETVQA